MFKHMLKHIKTQFFLEKTIRGCSTSFANDDNDANTFSETAAYIEVIYCGFLERLVSKNNKL